MLHSCYLPAGESELKHTYYLCRGGKRGMARGKGFKEDKSRAQRDSLVGKSNGCSSRE